MLKGWINIALEKNTKIFIFKKSPCLRFLSSLPTLDQFQWGKSRTLKQVHNLGVILYSKFNLQARVNTVCPATEKELCNIFKVREC